MLSGFFAAGAVVASEAASVEPSTGAAVVPSTGAAVGSLTAASAVVSSTGAAVVSSTSANGSAVVYSGVVVVPSSLPPQAAKAKTKVSARSIAIIFFAMVFPPDKKIH